MNNKGQTWMMSILFAFMIFIIGIVLLNLVFPDVTLAKQALNCANASQISDGNKLTCLIVGGTIPYLFLLIVSIAGGRLISKIIP